MHVRMNRFARERIGMMCAAMALTLVLAATGAAAQPAAAASSTTAGRVRTCLPLADGAVLVGADGGLLRLDAALEWTASVGAGDGLPGARVHTLAAGPGGAVWVGTEGGLALVDPNPTVPRVVRSWPGAPVRAVLTVGDALYVGTWGDGVARIAVAAAPEDRLQRLPVRGGLPSEARERVTSLVALDGVVYAGSAGAGLFRVEDGRALVPVAVDLPHPQIFALGAWQGRLWVGTLGGVVVWDPERGAVVGGAAGGAGAGATADVRAFAVVDGALVAGTYGEGLWAPEGAVRAAGGGLPDGVRFVDAVAAGGGGVCVAAHEGLWVRRDGRRFARAALDGPPSADVTALARDGDRVWVGTFDGGLALRGADGRLERFEHPLVDRRVNAVAVETVAGGGRRVWVGTARGLAVIEDGGRVVRLLTTADGLPHDEVHAVVALRAGGVVVGTGRGAAVIRGGRLEPLGAKRGLPKRAVWALAEAEDEGGTLWIGTTVGLYRLRAGRRAERFCAATGHLPDDWVTAIALGGHGLWVGTYAHGVVRLDAPGRGGGGEGGGARTATAMGLEHVNPGGLGVHEGRLYAATMEGLWSAPTGAAASGTAWRLHEDAAPSEDVTAFVSTAAGLLVASRRGLGP